MGRKVEKEHLTMQLSKHLNDMHDTMEMLNNGEASKLQKVAWEEVVKMGEQVSKQATIAGMLWAGDPPKAKSLQENMASYFNTLQGFLLVSRGSMVGAGPTLSSFIHESVKQVVDCSFKLMKESISFYDSLEGDPKTSIPPLVGTAWDACSSLKRTPGTNIVAVGRAMTQVAGTMKDVLREMKELKPACSDPPDESSDINITEDEKVCEEEDDVDSCGGDLGNDLSPEEMEIAHAAIEVVSATILVIKELMRSITGLLKKEQSENNDNLVTCLEKLLKLCRGIGEQIDEIGACLYPPQEAPAMKIASEKILSFLDDIQVELKDLKGSSDSFIKACTDLKGLLRKFDSQLNLSQTADLEVQMQNTALSS